MLSMHCERCHSTKLNILAYLVIKQAQTKVHNCTWISSTNWAISQSTKDGLVPQGNALSSLIHRSNIFFLGEPPTTSIIANKHVPNITWSFWLCLKCCKWTGRLLFCVSIHFMDCESLWPYYRPLQWQLPHFECITNH